VISNQCIPISAVRINRLFFARTRANIDLLAHGTLLSTELHARSLQLSQCVAGHKILSKQQPGFPGWPFLGQISKIWQISKIKLVGLKSLFGFLAFFSPHLKLVVVWPFGSLLAFLCWKSFPWKILLFHFLRQHICKNFVINAILDRHPRSDISTIWRLRDLKFCA